jgi:hypothetical protein
MLQDHPVKKLGKILVSLTILSTSTTMNKDNQEIGIRGIEKTPFNILSLFSYVSLTEIEFLLHLQLLH